MAKKKLKAATKKKAKQTRSDGLPLKRRKKGVPPADEVTPRDQYWLDRKTRTVRDPNLGKEWMRENAFWTKRDSRGLELLFSSPADLWDAACAYFELCRKNPWYHNDVKVVKGKLKMVKIPVPIPFTLKGLCVYLGTIDTYWKQFKNQVTTKDDPYFKAVIEKIESIIYTQKFVGAAVGAFKESLIARDLGLADSLNVNMTPDSAKTTAQLFPLVHPDDFEDAQVVDDKKDGDEKVD